LLYTYVWAHWYSTFHSNMEVVNDSNFFLWVIHEINPSFIW
jgi:hypothetical protein